MLIRGVNAHPLCFDSIEGFKKKNKQEREREIMIIQEHFYVNYSFSSEYCQSGLEI